MSTFCSVTILKCGVCNSHPLLTYLNQVYSFLGISIDALMLAVLGTSLSAERNSYRLSPLLVMLLQRNSVGHFLLKIKIKSPQGLELLPSLYKVPVIPTITSVSNPAPPAEQMQGSEELCNASTESQCWRGKGQSEDLDLCYRDPFTKKCFYSAVLSFSEVWLEFPSSFPPALPLWLVYTFYAFNLIASGVLPCDPVELHAAYQGSYTF